MVLLAGGGALRRTFAAATANVTARRGRVAAANHGKLSRRGVVHLVSRHRVVAMAQKPNVVFVLGGPGAGKGTQCEKIVQTFGFVHLSAGDLLRAERKVTDSQFGELIEHHITNGTIVPVEITCSLLERAIADSAKTDFLIDGFPRNEDNLMGWNKQMGEKVNLKFVLFLHCAEETCVERCLSRGAAGSGRTDDNIHSLKKRIVTFNEATVPIIAHYEQRSLVRRIDAGRPLQDVWADVAALFRPLAAAAAAAAAAADDA